MQIVRASELRNAGQHELFYNSRTMLSTLIALTTIAFVGSNDPVCPIMGSPVNEKSATVELNGSRYAFCCAGCDTGFKKDPDAAVKKMAKEGKVAGVFLFDPVSRDRLTEDIKGVSVYEGIKYQFLSSDNKAAFDADPKKYVVEVKKEALYCPVGQEEVKAYSAASGYADHDGVRYYFCCAGCTGKFAEDPAKFVGNAKSHVKAPAVVNPPKKK